MSDFLILGSKITADGDCSHEIKRCLLIWRKAMKKLDKIFKRRDITLLKKVEYNQLWFSSCRVWMWQLELKAWWVMKNWCLWTVVLDRTLGNALDYKEIQPVSVKRNQSWIFIRRMMLKLKLQHFGQLMWRTYSLEKTLLLGKIEGQRTRGWQRMRWLDGITNSMHMTLKNLQELVKESETWHAEGHGVAKSWSFLRDWTELNIPHSKCYL